MARWNRNTKAGLFSVIGIVTVAMLILMSDGCWLERRNTVQVNVIFEYVPNGLASPAPVEMKGVRIGWLREVRRLDGNKTTVSIEVEPKQVHAGDEAQIDTMGLLGDKYIRIVPGMERGDFARPGATIKGQAAMRNKELEQLVEKLGLQDAEK